jgi:hypothetical protein
MAGGAIRLDAPILVLPFPGGDLAVFTYLLPRVIMAGIAVIFT